MPPEDQATLVLDHQFDSETCRHTINGRVCVLHCHHYASLYSQLADDCAMLDGKKLLSETAEDTFHQELSSYYADHQITTLSDRLALGEQYYAAVGLGQMEVRCAGPDVGRVELVHSHVDEGWRKKWGPRDRPVNFITQGYVAALFAAAFDRPPRAFDVTEAASIVSGADRSRFEVVAN